MGCDGVELTGFFLVVGWIDVRYELGGGMREWHKDA